MLMRNDSIRINRSITKPSHFARLQAPSGTWLLKFRPPGTVFMSVASLGGCVLRLCRNITFTSASIILGCPEVMRLWVLFHMKGGCENFEFKLEKEGLGTYLFN